ncbi:hypothetical protein F5144DRAFT_489374 [Chaetomium tenue]|uniref:Uncharacterized protein n=1 Tax=Chaetomium tenue TaxID=1854479 RepID=A0ACB7PA46_9PEZI|nr:hypothetical protein F5144DRAFT_489374 [Chaetomium globosum]
MRPDGPRKILPPSVRELWDFAYERLQDEDAALVSSFEEQLRSDANPGLTSSGSKVSRREMMEGILKAKMDKINEEVWKLRFGATEVQVKDMVGPVLAIVVNQMNQYVNGALGSNPYASLAWAGVSLLLSVLLNPSTQSAALGKGLEYIANLIVQSRMWEDLYVRRYETVPGGHPDASVSATHRGYMDAMELLYRKVLKFQITCCSYYARADVSRVFLDTVKWHDWEQLLNDIRDQENAFSTVRALWRDKIYDEECRAVEDRHRETAARWDSLGSDLSALRRAVEAVQNKKKNRGLFDWLCSIDPSGIHNGARNKHGSGTGKWLIKGHDQFKEWKTAPGSFLWLYGKAGCGKSILSSTVIAHLMDEHIADPTMGLAYFYFSFSDPGKQTLDGMLASLIRQLCCRRPAIPETVANLQIFKERGQRPDAKTLMVALQASFQGFSATYIVLDALDECPESNGERKRMLDTIREIVAADIPNLHIFCTSRDEYDIRRALDSPPLYRSSRRGGGIMDAEWLMGGDISQYVETSLGSSNFESWPPDIKDEAKKTLIQKADGM